MTRTARPPKPAHSAVPAEAPAPGKTAPSPPAEAAAPESGQTFPDPATPDEALDELRQKTILRLTRLIQEEENVERLAKLLKILCDIREADTSAPPDAAPTLLEKLQNISRQQQNRQPA